MSFGVRWLLCCVAAMTSPSLYAQTVSESEREAIRQEVFLEGIRDCKPDAMERCWYIYFGGGDKPGRRLWLIDLKDQSDRKSKNIVHTDILVIDESRKTKPLGAQGVSDFILQSMEVDCKQRQMRMRPTSFGIGLDGKFGYFEKYGGWSDWQDVPFMAKVIAASCDKNIRLRPLAHDMAWVGDYVRPVDAVDFVRRFLWQQ